MEGGLVGFVVEGPHRLASRNKLIGIGERYMREIRDVDHVTRRTRQTRTQRVIFKGIYAMTSLQEITVDLIIIVLIDRILCEVFILTSFKTRESNKIS